jgi:hypothetical protein
MIGICCSPRCIQLLHAVLQHGYLLVQCVQLVPVVVLHLPEAVLQAVVLGLKGSLCGIKRLLLLLLVSSAVLLAAVTV